MRNISKKLLSVLLILMIMVCTGCGKKDVICSAYDELYASNFKYTEKHQYSDDSYIYDGEFTAKPLVKHLVISKGEALWSELYTYEENGVFKGIAKIEDEWQEVEVVDDRFEGYEERDSIKINSKDEQTIDGVVYDVYKTEYVVDLSEMYQLEEILEACVAQEYYVNQDSGMIERIITDAREMDVMTSAALMMQMNGISAEEAYGKAKQNERDHSIEISIWYQGEDFKLEIPE